MSDPLQSAADRLQRAADWVERACESSIHEQATEVRLIIHSMTAQASRMFNLTVIEIRRELLSRHADRCIADLPKKVRKRC